jgi:hypothetical protein
MLGILKPQLLKASVAQLGPAMVALLNASVAVGQLPKIWALSAITAIPKAGSDTKTCDGYRGIAVGTLAAKLYGSMLDIRVSGWAEASELRAEGQFGFRKGKGTASASFILRTLVDQVKTQKGGMLYTCFVDFKKAYDSVPRHLLWVKLERRGVTGWVLEVIKAMYADVPMCVKSATGLGRVFQSKLGVKQGCPLSPLLFGLYLDDWEDELKAASTALDNSSAKFDFPNLAGKDLRSLMYADDLVQAATSMSGLRQQMALLEDFAARWGLTINASKTKVMVFSGKRNKKEEKAAVLHIGGVAVEVVDKFKYLGTIFHCSHLRALKWLFGVRKSTASIIVLAEAGRWPLALRWVKRLARFYNGPHKAQSESMLKSAFIANCQLKTNPAANSVPSAAERCWAAQLKRAFSRFGVEISLEEPTELNVNEVCTRWKEWYLNDVRNVDESRTKIYKYINGVRDGLPEYCAADCLQVPDFRRRQRLIQIRTGSHWLMEEIGRWGHVKREERVCKQCAEKEIEAVETVEHMIFDCPNFTTERADFSCLDFTNTNLYEFLQQPSTQLGSFADKCWHRHRELNPPPPSSSLFMIFTLLIPLSNGD